MKGWVPLTTAAAAARRPPRTLRTWARRGRITAACRLTDRAVIVWWPDVYQATFDTPRRAPRERIST